MGVLRVDGVQEDGAGTLSSLGVDAATAQSFVADAADEPPLSR